MVRRDCGTYHFANDILLCDAAIQRLEQMWAVKQKATAGDDGMDQERETRKEINLRLWVARDRAAQLLDRIEETPGVGDIQKKVLRKVLNGVSPTAPANNQVIRPLLPTNLYAVCGVGGVNRLFWRYPLVSAAVRYEIQAAIGCQGTDGNPSETWNYQVVTTNSETSHAHRAGGTFEVAARPGSRVRYRVRAILNGQPSDWSNTVVAFCVGDDVGTPRHTPAGKRSFWSQFVEVQRMPEAKVQFEWQGAPDEATG